MISLRRPVLAGAVKLGLLLYFGTQTSFGQAVPVRVRFPPEITLSIGFSNTQFPYYADNALGGSISVFTQRHLLAGTQIKASTYPYSARFWQSPVTAGYRIGKPAFQNLDTGWRHMTPAGYIGGGFSRSQDSGLHYEPLAAKWNPCLEGSAAIDIPFRRFTLRLLELSYIRTFTPVRELSTYNASMGISFRLQRGSPSALGFR